MLEKNVKINKIVCIFGRRIMFGQLFGNYLVEQKIIEKETLVRILAEASKTRGKLGFIAVAEKMLTQEQADEINHLQQQMDKRFGDIAVEKGMLTNEQVEELLGKQGSPFTLFLQLLIENTDMKLSEIDDCLEAFQKSSGFDDAEMEALKKDDIDKIVPVFAFASKPYVTDIVSLVLRNITRFVSRDFYIGRIKQVDRFEYRSLSGQKSTGDHNISIALAAVKDNSVFCNVAAGFSKESFTETGVEVYDAVGEFVNCISGLLATSLSEKGVEEEIQPQMSYENQIATGHAYVVPVYVEDKELCIYIAVDDEISFGNMPVVRKMRMQTGSEVTEDSKGTVVIVDDSGMSRKMLRNIIEEAGYTVIGEASDGMEGVLAYKQYCPDIITLDITMPNMDGTEALREIKDYDSEAKAIMITAAGQQSKIIEALKIGAGKFITKPFDKDEVIKGLNELMENK